MANLDGIDEVVADRASLNAATSAKTKRNKLTNPMKAWIQSHLTGPTALLKNAETLHTELCPSFYVKFPTFPPNTFSTRHIQYQLTAAKKIATALAAQVQQLADEASEDNDARVARHLREAVANQRDLDNRSEARKNQAKRILEKSQRQQQNKDTLKGYQDQTQVIEAALNECITDEDSFPFYQEEVEESSRIHQVLINLHTDIGQLTSLPSDDPISTPARALSKHVTGLIARICDYDQESNFSKQYYDNLLKSPMAFNTIPGMTTQSKSKKRKPDDRQRATSKDDILLPSKAFVRVLTMAAKKLDKASLLCDRIESDRVSKLNKEQAIRASNRNKDKTHTYRQGENRIISEIGKIQPQEPAENEEEENLRQIESKTNELVALIIRKRSFAAFNTTNRAHDDNNARAGKSVAIGYVVPGHANGRIFKIAEGGISSIDPIAIQVLDSLYSKQPLLQFKDKKSKNIRAFRAKHELSLPHNTTV